ncbi:MAG: PTS sugar transporter subunit IIA [Verrucomicrobium sp.]|nr:PTS sugar transporter subunit IIA [Verrucomicrobium sp.]
MLIADLLRPERLALDLQSATGPEAIREVASLVQDDPAIVSFDKFYELLLAREQLESTYLGAGVALPHARAAHIREMTLAIGRSKEGVRFTGAPEPVHLIFVIGTPQRMATEYLSVVGGLARMLKDAQVRDRLLAAHDAQAFIEVLEAAEKRF